MKIAYLLSTIGPLLSEHLCASSIIKVFRYLNLFGQVKHIHLYTGLCSTTLIEHTVTLIERSPNGEIL